MRVSVYVCRDEPMQRSKHKYTCTLVKERMKERVLLSLWLLLMLTDGLTATKASQFYCTRYNLGYNLCLYCCTTRYCTPPAPTQQHHIALDITLTSLLPPFTASCMRSTTVVTLTWPNVTPSKLTFLCMQPAARHSPLVRRSIDEIMQHRKGETASKLLHLMGKKNCQHLVTRGPCPSGGDLESEKEQSLLSQRETSRLRLEGKNPPNRRMSARAHESADDRLSSAILSSIVRRHAVLHSQDQWPRWSSPAFPAIPTTLAGYCGLKTPWSSSTPPWTCFPVSTTFPCPSYTRLTLPTFRRTPLQMSPAISTSKSVHQGFSSTHHPSFRHLTCQQSISKTSMPSSFHHTSRPSPCPTSPSWQNLMEPFMRPSLHSHSCAYSWKNFSHTSRDVRKWKWALIGKVTLKYTPMYLLPFRLTHPTCLILHQPK